MENQEKKQEFLLTICPYCQGKGKIGNDVCPNCLGKRVIGWRQGIFYYWGPTINTLTILERKLERLARLFVNGFLFLCGVAGLAVFLFYFYFNFADIFQLSFWLYPPKYTLFFWLSLLIDLYLFYRLSQESALKEKINLQNQVVILPAETETDDFWEQFKAAGPEKKKDISVSFSQNAFKSLEDAWLLAQRFQSKEVWPAHILGALLFFPKIALIFGRLGINLEKVAHKVNESLNKNNLIDKDEKGGNPRLSPLAIKVLLRAYFIAYQAREPQVSVIDLLLSIAQSDSAAQEILYDLGVDLVKIKNVVEWIRVNEVLRRQSQHFRKSAFFKPKGKLDRAMTAAATPTLDHYSQDLTLLAKFGYLEPCVGREAEIQEIFRVIEANNQSVILTGNPGVGKKTIIEGIARRMVTEEVPEIIQDKRLVSLNVARLISGADPAAAEGRLMQIIDEIKRAGNIVLFIKDIESMVGITSGEEGSLDLAEVLVSEITKGSFFCFATANAIDYARYIENSALGDALQNVRINEPQINEAIQILEAKTAYIEYKNKVYFSYGAIEQAVKLSYRYIHDRYLPEKAIQVIEQVAVFVRKNKGDKAIVLAEDVARLISAKVNIPLTTVTEKESEKLLHLEEEIHQRVIGQEEAVKMVAAALRRARAQLRDSQRPIANFLFLGPTGVGKTELSKTVAEVYFGSEKNMVRIDMSEYQEQSSVYRLIGSPPGKGSPGTSGYLTEAVRKNPFTLLLLDEIEKAHHDILNLFLQVMDDGRLTDGLGRTIDFTNVILIATSNAGTAFIQEKIKEGWTVQQIKDKMMEDEIKKYFTPEFVNRFDGVIVFKPLAMKEVIEITKLMLKKVAKQLEEKGIHFEASEEAVAELASAGFDPQYGARPLRRIVQERVSDVLANYLLAGKIARRDTVILEKGGVLKIKKAEKI